MNQHIAKPVIATSGSIKTGSLVAVGSGTAMASVCAIGLFEIESLVGGIWSTLAIMIAALICLILAYVFARLSDVLPSGAGLISYVSRGYGRAIGVVVIVPYLLLMLLLVGFESLIVGGLIERLFKFPTIAGATVFIIVTWAVCKSGLRLGYHVQSWTTLVLFFSLVGVSLVLIVNSAQQGDLAMHWLPEAPGMMPFATAVGQAIFLFLGFELLTSHVEVAKPRAVRNALPLSVGLLFVFYTILSLGFSVLSEVSPTSTGDIFIPQVAIAEQAGGLRMMSVVALICILASFTSFNGALLALSRFVYALAAQKMLPRRFANIDRKLIAGPALNLLMFISLGLMLIVYVFGLYYAVIIAAAVTASFVYGMCVLTRERDPFRGAANPLRTWLARFVATGLFALGFGVIINTPASSYQVFTLLAIAYIAALFAAWHVSRKHSNAKVQPPGQSTQSKTKM